MIETTEGDDQTKRRAWIDKFIKRGLCVSIALLLGWWILAASLDILWQYRPFPEIYFIIVALILLITAGIFAVARIVYAILDLQIRLNEFLLTFLVTGGLMTFFMSLLHKSAYDASEKVTPFLFIILAIFAGTFVGSMWGWYAARRLQEEDTRRRLILMLKGWFLVIGCASGTIFALWTIIFLLLLLSRQGAFVWGSEFNWYVGFGLATFVTVPALLTERRIRRKEREEKSGSPVQ
jgi:hypothetical protein